MKMVLNWLVFCLFIQLIVLNLFILFLFYIDYMMMFENEKCVFGGGGCQQMSWCFIVVNCYGSDVGGSYELIFGDCGLNIVCCIYFFM